MEVRHSFCRICTNQCSILAHVEDGRVVKVTGDPESELYRNFTCIKGRSQPDYLYHPERVLHPLKRTDGGFVRISVDQATEEIAMRLRALRQRHGPRAIASWAGTMQTAIRHAMPMLAAVMDGLGSLYRFDPNTIDKGGKQIAGSLFGAWTAPAQGFDDPEVALLIGINPMVTFTGLPAGNPGQWLKDRSRDGFKLIVIDPRRSDVAARAFLHLAPRPGYDVHVLAAMLRVILHEGLLDRAFVAENIAGLEALRAALDPYTLERVSVEADVPAADLELAARTYGAARRAYAMAGTGAHMSGPGGLVEYLVLSLHAVCGNYLRAGETVRVAPALLPPVDYRAQAQSPQGGWSRGERFVRGLQSSAAGSPTGAAADHMLLEGEDRIRALISIAGNPAAAWPDQPKMLRALEGLDLFVQIDPWMSLSARYADYVIPPPMPLETAGLSITADLMTSRATGYGLGEPFAQYSPAIVEPPAGSEVVEEWRFLFDLGDRLGIDMRAATGAAPELTTEALIESSAAGSRVPLETVKAHRSGAIFRDASAVVKPKADGWDGRLDVGAAEMMADLARLAEHGPAKGARDDEFPLRLICRRHRHVYNTSCNIAATQKGRPYNPAFVNPDDLAAFGLASGDLADLQSAHGETPVVVEADPGLRRGLVSMMFGFGGPPAGDADVRALGSSVNRLTSNDEVFDRYTGQPRMSNLPVTLQPRAAG